MRLEGHFASSEGASIWRVGAWLLLSYVRLLQTGCKNGQTNGRPKEKKMEKNIGPQFCRKSEKKKSWWQKNEKKRACKLAASCERRPLGSLFEFFLCSSVRLSLLDWRQLFAAKMVPKWWHSKAATAESKRAREIGFTRSGRSKLETTSRFWAK